MTHSDPAPPCDTSSPGAPLAGASPPSHPAEDSPSGDLSPRSSSSARSSGVIAVHEILAEAQGGATQRLGKLLETYRNYLRLLATTQIDPKLRVRVSPSDLVQETMLGAFRDFAQFRGRSERELLGWLRRILINRLHVFVQQHVLAEKRDVRREFSLEEIGASLARSTANLEAGLFLAAPGPSPSSDVIRRENAVVLADHLASMPEDYRQILVLRNLKGLSFQEAAAQMERSSGAVRMLWLRAIKQLRLLLDTDADADTDATSAPGAELTSESESNGPRSLTDPPGVDDVENVENAEDAEDVENVGDADSTPDGAAGGGLG